MNTAKMKKTLKEYTPEILVVGMTVIGIAAIAKVTKDAARLELLHDVAAESNNPLIVGELIVEAATGTPKHIITTIGTFDLTPHVA